MIRRLLLLVSTMGSLTGPLRAQAPAQVAAFDQWRDSVASWPVDQLHSTRLSSAAARTPEERLHSAWLWLVEGDSTDNARMLAQAADRFYEVTVRRPQWVLGWYGLGEAKRELADRQAREVRSPHQSAGTGWVWGGISAYLNALKNDSTYTPAAEGISKLAPRLTSPDQFRLAWSAVMKTLTADSSSAETWLVVAQGASKQGDHETALRALHHALSLPDAPIGAVLLLSARELYAIEQPETAESLYYAGAGHGDARGEALYRQDIAYVEHPGELEAWDSLPLDARGAWLREFWGGRERSSGRPAGSRLIEHNRRRRYAVEHFSPLPAWMRQYDFNMENRDTLADLDDRGMVYVRHGEPDLTAGLVGGLEPAVLPNASWLYFRPEGNLLFHFVAGRSSGWHMTTSLYDLAKSKFGASPEVYSSRMGLDPHYGVVGLRLEQDSLLQESATKVGSAGGTSTYLPRALDFVYMIERERVDRRADIIRGLSTDSDPLRFDRELEPIVQVFGTAAVDPESGRLLVAVSVPASDRLQPTPLPEGGAGYVLRLRVTAADDSGRTTLDVDSLVRLRLSAPLAKGQHLSFIRTYDLQATGDQRVRLILTDSSRSFGAVRVVNGVPVPPLSRDRVEITDLVVGRPGSGITWHRADGVTIGLNPLNVWTPTQPLDIGFELGGLTPGSPYKVKIAIADLGADSTRPPKASVEFENQANGTRELVSQSLGLQTLRPGRYLLTVTVTAGDRSIRRERRITVAAQR